MTRQDVGELWLQRAADYAVSVRDGEIVACLYVKLAVERWFKDLETAHERGFYFCQETAKRYFRFIAKYATHSEGELAGKPYEYSDWQCFVEANVHGWLKKDGTRRFSIVYEEVARKNAKTLRVAANGVYYFVADGEKGPQVYSAATKRDQAREIFECAKAIIDQSDKLDTVATTEEHKIKLKKGRGRFVPLSKDSKRMDGFNVHAGLIDEVHAHPNSSLYNVIRSGTAARTQSIMRMITTAGFDRDSFCYQQRRYAIGVLQGTVPNADHYFAIIYTLDEDDDWQDEKNWIKANPNLGKSVKIEQLKEQMLEAKEMPDQMVEFKTKRLNIWVYGHTVWMPMEKWNKRAFDRSLNPLLPFQDDQENDEFYGQPCTGGLDLASVEDLTSFSLVFDRSGEKVVFQRSYLPEETFRERLKKGDTHYQKFVDAGVLRITPGESVNYDYIQEDILNVCERYDVQGIAFDRWNSNDLVNRLIDLEIPMVKFGQGHASMNAPMKELLRLVLKSKVKQNDPLLTWCMSNVIANKSPAGDIKPDKSAVKEKIDPAVASIMALALSIAPAEEDDGSDQGFVSVA